VSEREFTETPITRHWKERATYYSARIEELEEALRRTEAQRQRLYEAHDFHVQADGRLHYCSLCDLTLLTEGRRPVSEQLCEHGYGVNHCPHSAITCNYSHEYEAARHVPPPAGAELHPKVREWHEKQGGNLEA
jgi:hypothetical protein